HSQQLEQTGIVIHQQEMGRFTARHASHPLVSVYRCPVQRMNSQADIYATRAVFRYRSGSPAYGSWYPVAYANVVAVDAGYPARCRLTVAACCNGSALQTAEVVMSAHRARAGKSGVPEREALPQRCRAA